MKNELILRELQPYELYLKNMAFYFTKNNVEAEDLYQETQYKVFTKFHLYQQGTNLKSWVTTIMRNLFINNYRRKKKYSTVSMEDLVLYPEKTTTTGDAEFKLFHQEVEERIADLNTNHKEMIQFLRKGLSYDEISKLKKLPLGTVKSRIFFARKELKQRLKEVELI